MTHSRRYPRGFTLLELVLVMLIVCVALAMAAPSLRNFLAGRKSDDAAAEFVTMTQWARAQAILNGKVYRLVINIGDNSYQYVMQETGQVGMYGQLGQSAQFGPTGQFVPIGTEYGRIFRMPEETELAMTRLDQSGADYIDFYPTGRADPALIRIRDPHQAEIQIGARTPTESFHVITDQERS